MKEQDSASFQLYTLNASYYDSNYNNIEFNNFNIKECLGTLYDKYDKFKLVLDSMGNFNTITAIPTTNRLMILKMIGLDWEEPVEYKTNDKSKAILGFVGVGSQSGVTNILSGHNGCIFNKPSNDIVKLTIQYYNLLFDTIDTAYHEHSVFHFTIYGIDK